MTDQELVEGLINRDNQATSYFMMKYRPLFLNAISLIFDFPVDRDECVDELYLYLMKDEGAKLRSFEGRSTFGCWLKKVVIRFFRDLRNSRRVIDDKSQEPLCEKSPNAESDSLSAVEARKDIEYLFTQMTNRRYVAVIRALVLEDQEPETGARRMCVTVANLYNIKKRALAALANVAMNNGYAYGSK